MQDQLAGKPNPSTTNALSPSPYMSPNRLVLGFGRQEQERRMLRLSEEDDRVVEEFQAMHAAAREVLNLQRHDPAAPPTRDLAGLALAAERSRRPRPRHGGHAASPSG
jgi:hypothetical protein